MADTVQAYPELITIKDLNLENQTCRLLFAAVVVLSQTEAFPCFSETINGTKQTPDQILEHLKKLADRFLIS